MVILVVGKSGAGKSTHARRLVEELRAGGQLAQVLEGDVFRAMMGNKDFTDMGRHRNLKAMAETAQLIEANGRTAIVACMAPRREWRDMMRGHWQESRLVYLPGGELWPGTTYEVPVPEEFNVYRG